jgi:hypothetical protein
VANLVSLISSSFSRISRSNSLPTGTPVISKSVETSDGNSNHFNHVSSSSSLSSATLQSSSTGEDNDLRLLSDKVVAKLKTSFDMFISTQPEGCINTKGTPFQSPTSATSLTSTTILHTHEFFHSLQIGQCWIGSLMSSCHACCILLPRSL